MTLILTWIESLHQTRHGTKTDYDDWTRLLKEASVRHVRLQDGRHTAATLLLSENVDPRVVMELLGHSQLRTTMDLQPRHTGPRP
jgi:integrase